MQALRSRVPVTLALIALPILLAADAGAVTLMKLSVPDDADEAGRAGVQAILFSNVATPDEAQMAFNASKAVADTHHEHIDPSSFTITQDGTVTLTVSKHTGTILFKHLPILSGLTKTTVTTTVARASW